MCACVASRVTWGGTWHRSRRSYLSSRQTVTIRTRSGSGGGGWQSARKALHSPLLWQALVVSGPKASTLISLFNYYELENPWPMLIKAHQSAEGESGVSVCKTIPRHEQSSVPSAAACVHVYSSLSVCLSVCLRAFIGAVCLGAKPSSEEPLWISNETAAKAALRHQLPAPPNTSLQTATSDNNTKYGLIRNCKDKINYDLCQEFWWLCKVIIQQRFIIENAYNQSSLFSPTNIITLYGFFVMLWWCPFLYFPSSSGIF